MTGEPTFQSAIYEDELGAELTFRGLRMAALTLDQMLAGAVAFTDSDADPFIPMDAVQLMLSGDGQHLSVYATDRYGAYRERVIVNASVVDASAFLLHRDDVRTLRSLLKNAIKAVEKESRDVLPVDLMWGDTGFLEAVCEERRASFAPREHPEDRPYPNFEHMVEQALARIDDSPPDPLDFAVNAELLARLKPLQKVHGYFRLQRGADRKLTIRPRRGAAADAEVVYPRGAVVCRPLAVPESFELNERTLVILVMPVVSGPKTEAPEPSAASDFLRNGSGLHVSGPEQTP
jgi:hypothetical protein